MNIILFCFIYIVFTFSNNALEVNAWRCDYTYVKHAKGYFKFHSVPATWQDARLRCQLEGSVLASPYPGEVYETMESFMRSHKNVTDAIYTGIHATFSNGDYHTINGTPLSEIPAWLKPAKVESNSESCLTMTSEGTLAVSNCNDSHPYICHKKKEDDDVFITTCGTNDRAYEYSEVTHNCYKYHVVPRTWSRAHMACSAEGGHLAIINSNEEAAFIKNIFNKNPDAKVIGKFRKDIAWLGFRVWNYEGDYRTVNDESLKDVGYQTFSSGEPNYPDSNHQFCGCSFRNALLCDYKCEEPIPFICEKKPSSLLCEAEDCTSTEITSGPQ